MYIVIVISFRGFEFMRIFFYLLIFKIIYEINMDVCERLNVGMK